MSNDQLEGIGLIIIGIGSLVASIAEYRRGERLDALVGGASGLWVIWDGVSRYRR